MSGASGFARARPIRVAFLVPDNEDSHLILDAVFANCHSRWGGRYSLIVPCEGVKPRDLYLPWLELFDADIVYSYVDMDKEAIARFYERFGPSYFLIHEPSRQLLRDKHYFRPELPITCMRSLAVAAQYARLHPASEPQPILVVDRFSGEPESRFLEDNFGSIADAFGFWPLPEQLSDTVRPLYVASDEVKRKWRSGRLPPGNSVADLPSLLTMMSQNSNVLGISQLSADSRPHFEIRDLQDSALRLTVGESFADRISFWNDRSRFPSYLGRSLISLIVSPALLEKEDFLLAFLEFLRQRNNMRPSNGSPAVELVSKSVQVSELNAYVARFLSARAGYSFHVSSQSVSDDVPKAQALATATHNPGATGQIGLRLGWREFPADRGTTIPPVVVPTMLEGTSASHATVGAWAVDVRLQRQNNLTRYSNVCHEWQLPRRLRLYGAFLGPSYSAWPSRRYYPRSTEKGELTFYTQLNDHSPKITLPDDRAALIHAILGKQGLFASFSSDFDRIENVPDTKYKHSGISDKGRYLVGTLSLFEGFQEAVKVLLAPVWITIFSRLGATVGADSIPDVVNKLQKRLKSFPRLETTEDWEKLALVVANEAQQSRLPWGAIGFDRVKELFGKHASEEYRDVAGDIGGGEDWIKNDVDSLVELLQVLCSRNILHQGYQWKCEKCFNMNWSDIQSLRPALMCGVCREHMLLPVDKSWDFRLNDFLRKALRDHGVLALVWCLSLLEERARNSFYYLEPTEFFSEVPRMGDGKRLLATGEADLVCVVDGKVYLCEVKSSSRGVDLSSLAEIAKNLRPDIALIAVMDSRSSASALLAKVEKLRKDLIPYGIQVDLLTLD